MKRLLTTLVFTITLCATMFSQGTSSIYLDGIFRNSSNGRLKDMTVEIVDAETGEKVMDLECNGKFRQSVKLNRSYTIYFRKEGYATKKIFVEKTDVNDKTFRFNFDMEMLKVSKRVKIDSEPVAVLRYDEKKKGYIYDPKYTEKMKKEIKDKIKKS